MLESKSVLKTAIGIQGETWRNDLTPSGWQELSALLNRGKDLGVLLGQGSKAGFCAADGG